MTKEQIARIINPEHPWVYAPTTAPTKLVLVDGSIKIGYFQYVKKSDILEKTNRFTFIEFGEMAEKYRATGDESYLTEISGDNLINVEYPSYSSHRMSLESVIRRFDDLKKQIEKEELNTQSLISHFRLDWGLELRANNSDEFTAGTTKQILLHGLEQEIYGNIKQPATNKIILLLNEFITSNILTKQSLSNLHKLIFVSDGEFRQTDATVHQRIPNDFTFVAPKKINKEIDKLLLWYEEQSAIRDTHPLILAAIFHYRFVSIHPFNDGNGRLARILTSIILLKNKIPPPVVKLEDRVFYIDSLQRANEGDLEGWIKFLGQKVIQSMEYLVDTK